MEYPRILHSLGEQGQATRAVMGCGHWAGKIIQMHPAPYSLIIALLAFGVGFATQRGSIWSILAARQIAETGRATRLVAFVTASLWALVIAVPLSRFSTELHFPKSVVLCFRCCIPGRGPLRTLHFHQWRVYVWNRRANRFG